MKFIKSGDKLKCNVGTVPGGASCISGGNVLINSEPVIKKTDIGIIGTFGLCQNQPISAPPGFLPCVPAIIGGWNNPKNDVKNGLSISTEKSSLNCSFGGKITPITKSSNVGDGASAVNLSSLSLFVLPAINTKKSKSATNNLEQKNMTKEKKIITSKDEKKTIEQQEICNICNKPIDEKHNNHYIQKGIDDINNDSKILRENMRTGSSKMIIENKNEAKYINNKMKKITGLTYNIDSEASAAHHLISGNQIFKKFPNIVSIALGAGYDINCFENGIFLPTLTNKTKERLKFHKRKNPVAFEAMSEIKRQWHLGGHSYNANFSDLKINHGDYVSEICKLLNPLEKNWLRKIKCENDPKQNKTIINNLNSISKKIRKKLNYFRIDPKKSAPFFVSKVAMQFAYQIPKTIKFIVFEFYEKVQVYKFEYKSKNNILYKIDEKVFEPTQLKEFIFYCENIRHFVTYQNENCTNFIPFSDIKKNRFLIKKNRHFSLEKVIERNKFDIINFLKNDTNYENSRSVIKRRKEELI